MDRKNKIISNCIVLSILGTICLFIAFYIWGLMRIVCYASAFVCYVLSFKLFDIYQTEYNKRH